MPLLTTPGRMPTAADCCADNGAYPGAKAVPRGLMVPATVAGVSAALMASRDACTGKGAAETTPAGMIGGDPKAKIGSPATQGARGATNGKPTGALALTAGTVASPTPSGGIEQSNSLPLPSPSPARTATVPACNEPTLR